MIRVLAVVALATMSIGAAQAGSLTNGTWTPSSACVAPGDAPTIMDKSADAYNKSAKLVQAWQASAQAYASCAQAEAKTDQNAVVSGANESISKLSDQLKAVGAANDAAIAKLKAKK
jgi:hypothetical protein